MRQVGERLRLGPPPALARGFRPGLIPILGLEQVAAIEPGGAFERGDRRVDAPGGGMRSALRDEPLVLVEIDSRVRPVEAQHAVLTAQEAGGRAFHPGLEGSPGQLYRGLEVARAARGLPAGPQPLDELLIVEAARAMEN